MRRGACIVLLAGLTACGDEPDFTPVADVNLDAGRSFYDEEAAARAVEARAVAEAEAAAQQAARLAADQATEGREDELAGLEGDALLEEFGWVKDKDGYIVLSFLDLGLEGHDQELLVESLLYPEDYADDEIEWPARIRALDGKKVALTGYMLPLLWEETEVPHFMLVRDLLACCFGGAPQPDEFADVKMKSGGSTYWAYVPVVVRGTFKLLGIADEAGYAAGAYTIEADDTRREL